MNLHPTHGSFPPVSVHGPENQKVKVAEALLIITPNNSLAESLFPALIPYGSTSLKSLMSPGGNPAMG